MLAGLTPTNASIYPCTVTKRHELVHKLKSRQRGDWSETVQRLWQFYQGNDQVDKYSWDKLNRYVGKERFISKKKHFVEYFHKFNKDSHNLHDGITTEDQDHLFWKGLLCSALFLDLASALSQDARMLMCILICESIIIPFVQEAQLHGISIQYRWTKTSSSPC